jgi:hypothetical protein
MKKSILKNFIKLIKVNVLNLHENVICLEMHKASVLKLDIRYPLYIST